MFESCSKLYQVVIKVSSYFDMFDSQPYPPAHLCLIKEEKDILVVLTENWLLRNNAAETMNNMNLTLRQFPHCYLG